ncbi:hypothetical protein RHGRI_026631 [Rhododendron griersonianum]|uniref:GRF-type domain-containing protein n=1 Tax=Rhododendron griersonianum TaxID=479676 RepID=A0AAV6ITE7_9ERIC|nr:hypothetical protein RHGRI_026631 [Rhododendron griersonianum]
MSSSSSYYRGKNEAKKGVNNTPKLVYIPMECRCGMRAEIKIVEVNPDTRGELYYSCCKPVRERCGFFKWCRPVGWPSIGNIGGWVFKEPTCASATANSDDVVAHERERYPDCHKFRLKPLALEEEMRILFGTNTAIGEGAYAPNSGVMPRTRERPPVFDVDNIDELLDDDATQELVHPTKVQKQVAVDGSGTKKGKGKKGTVTSRLEACMQQICDSTDSASSPSVQRATFEIPTMKKCVNKLSELREFNEDAELWAQGLNLFKDSKIRALFMSCPDDLRMSCPDDLRMYHFITQELNRARTAELAKTWFAPAP